MTKATRSQAVTFSEFSELAFIPKDEVDTKWYSSEEMDGFRLQSSRDSRRVSKKVQESLDNDTLKIKRELLYECVGMEISITPGLAPRVLRNRQEHVRSVLLEQDRQKLRGSSDVEKISRVSYKRSRDSSVRAMRVSMRSCFDYFHLSTLLTITILHPVCKGLQHALALICINEAAKLMYIIIPRPQTFPFF